MACDGHYPCWRKYSETPIKDINGKVKKSGDFWVLDWPLAFLAGHPVNEVKINSYKNFLASLPKIKVQYGVEDKIFNSVKYFKHSSEENIKLLLSGAFDIPADEPTR